MLDQNRVIAKQAWSQAGLYNVNDPKLQSFLQHFEQAEPGCWPDLGPLVRAHYLEYLEQLLTPIWDTGEKSLRLNMIQFLTSQNGNEVELFQRLAQRPDTQSPPWEHEGLMRVARRRGLIPTE